jgi:hypothetical protein
LRDDLTAWMRQQYFMSVSLSPCFAALSSSSDLFDWSIRLRLLDLAIEEEWDAGPHARAFLSFWEALGGRAADLAQEPIVPATLAAAHARLALCHSAPGKAVGAGALTLALANEYANRIVFADIRKAIDRDLRRQLPLEYLSSHVIDEVEHGDVLVTFALTQGLTENDAPAVAASMLSLLDKRAEFFDAVALAASAARRR